MFFFSILLVFFEFGRLQLGLTLTFGDPNLRGHQCLLKGLVLKAVGRGRKKNIVIRVMIVIVRIIFNTSN